MNRILPEQLLPEQLLDTVEVRENATVAHRDIAAHKMLEAECHLFARYLVQQAPTAYVLRKYCEAHEKELMFRTHKIGSFDRWLLRLARGSVFGTKLVDTYAALFARSAVVRRKIILLLAILESCAPTATYFEAPESAQRLALLLKLGWRALVFCLVLGCAVVILLPLQLLLSNTE